MNNGATFVKIDKMKHSPDGDYSLVIEGDTPLFSLSLGTLVVSK